MQALLHNKAVILKGFDPLAFYKHETGGKRDLSTIDGIFSNAFFICGKRKAIPKMELKSSQGEKWTRKFSKKQELAN